MSVRKLLAVVPMFALFAGLFGVASVPEASAATSSITVNAPSSIRAGQNMTVTGRLTLNGRAAANVPVVISLRPTNGPEVNAGTGFTDASGNYRVTVRIPNNYNGRVQVTAVSGGGTVPSARNARFTTVR